MKLTLLAIALIVAVAAQDADIHATFLPSLQNVWNTQYLQVENLLPFSNRDNSLNIITDVSFTVFASKAPKGAKIGFSFPGDNNYYGVIGAINGNANGTGSFAVNGQAGQYELTIGAAWLKNGKRGGTLGKFPYTIVKSIRDVEEANEDDIVIEFNDVETGFAKRDGNSTDLAGINTNFAGYAQQVTWNRFGFKAGSTALYGLTFTFTPSDIDNVGCSNGNNTKNVAANANGAADFTIYGTPGTYVLTIRADYRKGSAVGTKGSWFANYAFAITANSGSTSLTKKAEVKSYFEHQLEELNAESNGVAKSDLAIGAAIAGVACVAAVAVVAAVVIIRRKQTEAISA